MKIWCTDTEKKMLIEILASDYRLCVFGKVFCARDDCEKCLEESIDWHTVKEKHGRSGA